MLYNIAKALVNFALVFVFRVRKIGIENIPEEGGVILAVNHRSYWDPVLAAATCKRSIRFMAKEELFKNPVFGTLIKALGAFPIKRGKGDIGAIKGAMKILRGGDVMLIFPEGRRIKDGGIVKAKPGVALIAQMARVPVVPVNISGKYAWMRKITVTYGQPILLDEYYEKKLEQTQIQEIADGVLDGIRRLSV